jgi:predicted MPP superfamily phosphohydrolase
MPFLLAAWRHAPELIVLALAVLVQIQFTRWLAQTDAARRSPALLRLIRFGGLIATLWVGSGIFGNFPAVYRLLPSSTFLYWFRGGAIAWCLASLGAFLALALWRRIPRFSQERRGFIRAAGTAFVAAPFAAMSFGILVERHRLHLREVDIRIPNLPKDLDGLRLAQLSDIHLSPFLTEGELARAVDMANETRPHLAVVTGDLITSHGDPLDACLRQLARLRADAGTLGCLGNHEIYAGVEDEAAAKAARLGMPFLRHEARRLRFGGATLNVAGVDYQKMHHSYLVGAEGLKAPNAVNILLSHNPDVFDVAATQGWDLTLSGHTHGGQVTIEILNQHLSAARFFTPYVYGLYRAGGRSIWVTRGIGTVGLPARLGAPPEVVLVRLCATSS